MNAVRVSVALLLAIFAMAGGPRTPSKVAADTTDTLVSSLERGDAVPLAYLAEAGPLGVVAGFDPNRVTTGSTRTMRVAAAIAEPVTRPARIAALVRARLEFVRFLRAAGSGWFLFTTTAPPPIPV
ncbi:MAG: hypothetical protein ACRELX_02345 [Longimicrobiales bacterium]